MCACVRACMSVSWAVFSDSVLQSIQFQLQTFQLYWVFNGSITAGSAGGCPDPPWSVLSQHLCFCWRSWNFVPFCSSSDFQSQFHVPLCIFKPTFIQVCHAQDVTWSMTYLFLYYFAQMTSSLSNVTFLIHHFLNEMICVSLMHS